MSPQERHHPHHHPDPLPLGSISVTTNVLINFQVRQQPPHHDMLGLVCWLCCRCPCLPVTGPSRSHMYAIAADAVVVPVPVLQAQWLRWTKTTLLSFSYCVALTANGRIIRRAGGFLPLSSRLLPKPHRQRLG